MRRKQLTQFSVDELIMLKHLYLEEIPKTIARDAKIRRIIVSINKEIFVKKNKLQNDSSTNRKRTSVANIVSLT